MHVRDKVKVSLFLNSTSVLLAAIILWTLNDGGGGYFSFGPNSNLRVLSATIDTWTKWTVLVIFISIMGFADVISEEIGMPVLNFTIYNPDKKYINEFSKNQLQLCANLTYLVISVKRILLTVLQVTQFDLALIHVIVTETTTIFTIRHLLNEKEFGEHGSERLTRNESRRAQIAS